MKLNSILFFGLLLFVVSCAPATDEPSQTEAKARTISALGEKEVLPPAGYEVGDAVADFSLKNVDGSMVSLSDYKDEKGVVVVFSCNHCPYVVAYEDRMIELHNKVKDMGYPLLAINSNDPEVVPEDSFEEMVTRSKEKAFPFPYVFDESFEVLKSFGATRTPHVYLLKNEGGTFKVAYIGAIDDNAQDATAVKVNYVESAITSIESGVKPDPEFTKAIGCTIKKKK